MVKTHACLKKAILIGDFTNPPYHPLKDIDKEISRILADEVVLQSSEDYEMFSADRLNEFELCISYTDCWDRKVSPNQVAGLLSFVSGGGGLLVIHNGISLQCSYELAQLIGGRFTGHPPMRQLPFSVSAPEHMIMAGIGEFRMQEEPYQFLFDEFTEKTILLEYHYEDRVLPAAWAHQFGMGKVVYLMPGHNIEAFKNDVYRRIIFQSAQWLVSSVK